MDSPGMAAFRPIDWKNWPRAQTFTYFAQAVTPTAFTVSVGLDITILRSALKKRRKRFFPTFLYLATRAIGSQPELRMGSRDGEAGVWDYLVPQYPVFHDDDKTVTYLWTEYDREFPVFYGRYLDDLRQYGEDHGIFSQKGPPPENNYVAACIPWFSFRSVSIHMQEIEEYYAPMLEIGKFEERLGGVSLPLSITINHAAADGYHIKVFLDELQRMFNHPAEWLDGTGK